MLALFSSTQSFTGAAVRPAVQARTGVTQMADIWGFEAKKAIYDQWDPEKPRDYDNFNPFERNGEGAMCDTNGCFPGQSKGYKSPTRPDVSWAQMQEQNAAMDALKTEAKYQTTGQPGNWFRKWQDNLGSPP